MSLRDDLRRLSAEYWDEENEDGAADAAAHYIELHPRIAAVLEAAQDVCRTWEDPATAIDYAVDTLCQALDA